MILNESQLFGFFNHLLCNMFRQYVVSHHQALLNDSLKSILTSKHNSLTTRLYLQTYLLLISQFYLKFISVPILF